MKRMHLAAAGAVALGMLAIGADSAAAQAAAASPFHAGEWGVEGYATGQTGGILRFFTPRTAFVFTLSADRLSTSGDDAGFGPISSKETEVDATLGVRRHSMLAQHVAATLGAGIAGGSVKQDVEYPFPTGTSSYHASYLGAYVDVGGQYMVADHFAIGLAYRLSGSHINGGGSSQSGSEFAMSFLPIRATLYF